MALAPGTRLGPYEVIAQIGEGGMGEVYRATDTALKRVVAIKVLPAALAADPERIARFQREAEILAALNHPHIAIIHGLEKGDGFRAIVMELVTGVDLTDRIRQRAMPIEEALPIARQIAEALEAAHQAGIIHRDLKPSNVKVRPDGTVKVLDFGLAKALDPMPTDLELSEGATVTSPARTVAGVILGTAAYMSPEQARGQSIDKRTDVWAFGCVLYEMLTGQAPFARPTVSDAIAAILERSPDWTLLPDATPPSVRRLIARCLAKDRQRRLCDMGDARLEIEETISSPLAALSTAAPPSHQRWQRPLVGVVIGMAVALVVVWALALRRPIFQSSESMPARFAVAAPDGYALDVNRSPVAVSRDGRSVAFAASRNNTQRIFLRDVDKLEPTALPGTEGGFSPFFSPDGRWVGFFAGQKIRKVFRSGGEPISIGDIAELAGSGSAAASWDTPDTIFYTPDVAKGIWRLSASGGTPALVTAPAAGESFHIWPQLLPGEKAILFTAIGDGPDPYTYVQLLDTGARKPLVRGLGTRYLPTGHLVFVQAGSLMAVPFDLSRLEVTGPAISVVSQVTEPFRLRTMATGFNPLFDVSPTGTLAFLSAGRAPQNTLVWVDRAGHEQAVGASGRTYAQPRLSPDGRRIAVVIRGDDRDDIWLYDLNRSTWDRVTSEGNSSFPVWTPDGTRIVYNSDRSGSVGIEWKRLDGNASETLLRAEPGTRSYPFSWSSDGLLAFVALRPAQDLWTVRPGGEATALLTTPFAEGAPMFAPDGRAFAYVSNETGRNEIHLRPFPGPGEKVTITNEGGNEPYWSPTGRELFYRNGDAMMAVEVSTNPVKAGVPRKIFEGHYEPSLALYANYSVTPDGERFLMVKRIDQGTSQAQINVAVNWFDELRRATNSR